MTVSAKQVIIVGGGIAGLATAFALQEEGEKAGLPVACTLLEAESYWGGKIVTHRVDELVIEAGPDSFLSQKPWALELCQKLGLSQDLINTNETQKKAFVFSRGLLRELPEGLVVIVPSKLGPFLRSGLLSVPGMARMALDLVLPPKHVVEDESLASFFTRRFGREAFERLIEPLMAGIYAGDAAQMSLRATFPRFLDLEQQHGSVMRGMLGGSKARAAPPPATPPTRTLFVTLRNGLADLVRALVRRIESSGGVLRSGQRVTALRVGSRADLPRRYELFLDSGETVAADAVVLATPAYTTAECIRPLAGKVADLLENIPYASTATVSLAYDRDKVRPSVQGFGFVVPRIEQRHLLAATWTSQKWAHRAPPSQLLVRSYVGGVGREEILTEDVDSLLRLVRHELQGLAGITGEPLYVEVNRWMRGMPQYTIGHLDRLAEVENGLAQHPGLYVTGAAYRGVGIPDCVRDGTHTAGRVVRYLAEGRS